jgi:dTDP-4-dehydrorhamnose reductase
MVTISILGASGMLGSGVVDYLSSRNFELIEINRHGRPSHETSAHIKFDAATSNIDDLVDKIPEGSIVINCAGVIKHKIDIADPRTINEAIRVNSLFPYTLANACMKKDISIIQVATDCVYSGKDGNYSESTLKDPQDIYGITKSAGEFNFDNTMTLRCSLVGLEKSTHIEFLEWVLSHPRKGTVTGFTNHLWNGVTVLDIAKFIEGAVHQKFFRNGIHHLVPEGSMSKFELIQLFCAEFDRGDLVVKETEAKTAVNRVLVTDNPELNAEMWSLAQYNKVPSIPELLATYAAWIKKSR